MAVPPPTDGSSILERWEARGSEQGFPIIDSRKLEAFLDAPWRMLCNCVDPSRVLLGTSRKAIEARMPSLTMPSQRPRQCSARSALCLNSFQPHIDTGNAKTDL